MPTVLPAEATVPAPTGQCWRPGPPRPRLVAGALDVWRTDLTAVSDDLAELLDADERARAARMARAVDRQLWARARGVLRMLLGRYLQCDPAALRFAAQARGKPALLGRPPGSEQLAFNLSHCQGLALYACSLAGAVGVDVQFPPRRPVNEVALAARAFGAAEARRLRGLGLAIREREFLRAWTRHEAELKRRGTGIGCDPPGWDSPQGARPLDFWIVELEVAPGAAAAVAVARRPRVLRLWDWPRQGAI